MKDKRFSDHETYYLHCLRFYIPKMARHAWKTQWCGIEIYSIQGFERRNKESKNCMKQFNNNKQHRMPQSLLCLRDIFFCRKKRNKERSIKVIKLNYIIIILLLQLNY